MTLYRTKNWVEKQVSVSLAVLDECCNDSGGVFVSNFVNYGYGLLQIILI